MVFNSGIPDNALGSREERMFWMIVDPAAMAHTVLVERKKYTIDFDTACSTLLSVLFIPMHQGLADFEIIQKLQFS